MAKTIKNEGCEMPKNLAAPLLLFLSLRTTSMLISKPLMAEKPILYTVSAVYSTSKNDRYTIYYELNDV
jgi:hypothetical protein